MATLLALCLSLGAEGAAKATADKPAYLWLWYADGKTMPEFSQYCDYIPPAYQCNFGSSLDDCKAQVQAYLDAWYEDFNLVFTLTRPPSTSYYTIVITSGWPQCATEAGELTGGSAITEGGISPHACVAIPEQTGTGIAIQCGKNAHDCAAIIAHEHGHLFDLEHTDSKTDVMNRTIQATAVGFDNKIDYTTEDGCDRPTQNSYQTMLKALGAWPSGTTKPSLWDSVPDAGADTGTPDVAPADTADAPSTGGSVGITTPRIDIDSGVVALSGFDAIARPSLPTVDASGVKTSTSASGCSMAPARPPASTSALLLGLAALLASRSALRGSGARRTSTRRAQSRDLLA